MDPALPHSLQAIAPIITHYGYFAVFGLLFVEDFGVPAPGETILIAASVFAGLGKLNIFLVIIVAIIAAYAGDNLGYVIGKYGGRRLVKRFGLYVFITPKKLAETEKYFRDKGPRIIIVARFIEGLRQLNGILAGITEMSWRRFTVFNAIGGILWVLAWSMVGYFGGNHIDTIEHYGTLLAAVAGIGIIAYVAVLFIRRRSSES